MDLHLHSHDQARESKILTYLYDTTAPLDVLLRNDVLQQGQSVMAWRKEGLKTFLIPGLAHDLVKIYDPITPLLQKREVRTGLEN